MNEDLTLEHGTKFGRVVVTYTSKGLWFSIPNVVERRWLVNGNVYTLHVHIDYDRIPDLNMYDVKRALRRPMTESYHFPETSDSAARKVAAALREAGLVLARNEHLKRRALVAESETRLRLAIDEAATKRKEWEKAEEKVKQDRIRLALYSHADVDSVSLTFGEGVLAEPWDGSDEEFIEFVLGVTTNI